jgi:hypothetical protein
VRGEDHPELPEELQAPGLDVLAWRVEPAAGQTRAGEPVHGWHAKEGGTAGLVSLTHRLVPPPDDEPTEAS